MEEGQLTDSKRRQELEALNAILQVLNGLEEESRQRLFQTVATYYQFAPSLPRSVVGSTASTPTGLFSDPTARCRRRAS